MKRLSLKCSLRGCVDLYTITSNLETPAYRAANLGAGIVRLYMPDRNGNLGDVVLGFDDPALYTDPDLGYQGRGWVAGPTVFAALRGFQGQTTL